MGKHGKVAAWPAGHDMQRGQPVKPACPPSQQRKKKKQEQSTVHSTVVFGSLPVRTAPLRCGPHYVLSSLLFFFLSTLAHTLRCPSLPLFRCTPAFGLNFTPSLLWNVKE